MRESGSGRRAAFNRQSPCTRGRAPHSKARRHEQDSPDCENGVRISPAADAAAGCRWAEHQVRRVHLRVPLRPCHARRHLGTAASGDGELQRRRHGPGQPMRLARMRARHHQSQPGRVLERHRLHRFAEAARAGLCAGIAGLGRRERPSAIQRVGGIARSCRPRDDPSLRAVHDDRLPRPRVRAGRLVDCRADAGWRHGDRYRGALAHDRLAAGTRSF
jgi:hypothetical protein